MGPIEKVTWETVLEVAEEQFPKGQCKERGQLLVVLAYAKMALDGVRASLGKPEGYVIRHPGAEGECRFVFGRDPKELIRKYFEGFNPVYEVHKFEGTEGQDP